jgi:hypothetical protein
MKTFKEFLTPASILILAGVMLFDHGVGRPVPGPANVPVVNGLVLGRAYAPVLLSTYGDAWLAAAAALEQGKSVAEAQKALEQTGKDARARAFTAQVAPSFSMVLPEGAEP